MAKTRPGDVIGIVLVMLMAVGGLVLGVYALMTNAATAATTTTQGSSSGGSKDTGEVFGDAIDSLQSGDGLFQSDGLFGTGFLPGLF